VKLLDEAGAPQIPALAFSLAILARLGPLLAFADDFWMPALALAVDQRDPKASPDDLDAAGLPPTDEVPRAEVKEKVEGIPGRWPGVVAVGCCVVAVVTEVK
jgi:hypothetical protein